MRILSVLLLPVLVIAQSPAIVYLQPNPGAPGQNSLPSLSPYEANSVLANYVGLSHSIWDGLEEAIDFGKKEFEHLWHSVHPRGEAIGAGSSDVVMLLLQSDHPEDFIPSHFEPSFSIPNPPSSSTFSDLLDTYIEKAHNVFDSVISSLAHVISHSSAWKSLLDIFDLTPSESSSTFVDEYRALTDIIERPDQEEESFCGLKLDGLAKITEEHGRDSEIYQTAAKAMQVALSQESLKTKKLALIVIPTYTNHHVHRDILKRDSPIITRSARPVHSISQCFLDAESCTNSTDTCSGRGECTSTSRAGKTCYSCACSPTIDSKGRKESWAGEKCERKDISVPFVLLAGSTIFLVALVIGSVQILYSVGEGVLPSTLTSTSSGHLKRD